MSMRAYNPLTVEALGRNSAQAVMRYPADALPPHDAFDGVGVYTLHYAGSFHAYAGLGDLPLYVGKADGAGPRALHSRLRQHARSISDADNLDLSDVGCRWLVLDPVWVGLTEQVLIAQYRPIWNDVVKGFGIHAPGRGRQGQQRSDWDMLHPGRPWAVALAKGGRDASVIAKTIRVHREQHHAEA